MSAALIRANPARRVRPMAAVGSTGSEGRPASTPRRWWQGVMDVPDIRWAKVLAIREALSAGRYDVEARLARLFDPGGRFRPGFPAGTGGHGQDRRRGQDAIRMAPTGA